jgi:phospholipid-translocating ATPase
MAQLLTSLEDAYFKQLVAVGFTALILNELIMVALEIITWNKVMFFSEIITFGLFVGSVPFLADYFDLDYMMEFAFYWKTAVITAAALIPPWIGKSLRRKLRPPNYAKVQQV